MNRDPDRYSLWRLIGAGFTYLAIFLVGLRYEYLSIFSKFHFYDDEGTMMLRVRSFIENPGSYELVSGMYGPFYYLHKYAIYSVFGAEVSHDFNRLTTIVFWGLVAAGCAFFVHRLSRSLLLAAVVQMQLILHLSPFDGEPGHPHEIALLVITAALICSSFVDSRRIGTAAMAGMGMAVGALLLIKVNLGVYLGAAVALSGLLFLRRDALVVGAGLLTASVALAIPTAIMWRHLQLQAVQNYCVLTTAVIASTLLVAGRRGKRDELEWSHAAAVVVGAVTMIVAVSVAIVAGGSSIRAIADSAFLRAMSFSSMFTMIAPIGDPVATASLVSLGLALLFALTARWIEKWDISLAVLSLAKLAYGSFTLYSVYQGSAPLLLHAIPVPFMWLLLVGDSRERLSDRLPRVLLCLTAAFQTLQAYPVHGSQAAWAGFLAIPVAALCIGDSWAFLSTLLRRRFGESALRWRPVWLQPVLTALLIGFVASQYYGKVNLDSLAAKYSKLTPLDLPGTARLRVPAQDAALIHRLVRELKANCDSFVGMPGFPSLYFWTEMPAPGPVNSAWMITLGPEHQSLMVDNMRKYDRPCAVHNQSGVQGWAGDKKVDPDQPLVRHILSDYKPLTTFSGYEIRVPSSR